MDNEKNTNTQDTDKNIEKSAKEASKLLELIRELKKAGENFNTYTHLFAEPFTYEGKTHEKLTLELISKTCRRTSSASFSRPFCFESSFPNSVRE